MDEDVDINLASRLVMHGYNVITTLEVGNLGNSDEKQLEYAISNDRTILTHNPRDFRRLHREYSRRARCHSGIIVSVRINLDELDRRLLNLLRRVSADSARNSLFSLSDFR